MENIILAGTWNVGSTNLAQTYWPIGGSGVCLGLVLSNGIKHRKLHIENPAHSLWAWVVDCHRQAGLQPWVVFRFISVSQVSSNLEFWTAVVYKPPLILGPSGSTPARWSPAVPLFLAPLSFPFVGGKFDHKLQTMTWSPLFRRNVSTVSGS